MLFVKTIIGKHELIMYIFVIYEKKSITLLRLIPIID